MKYHTPEIAKNVIYVGVRDPERRIFDSLIPLPQGTTYNSYLINSTKTALIYTVNPGFEQEHHQRINQNHPLEEIDYIIMKFLISHLNLKRLPKMDNINS